MDHILVSIDYIKMMDNQMRSIIPVTVHLSGVPKVLYNTVLWLCECSGLESALSPKCLVSHYSYHMLKSVLPCLYSSFVIEYHFCQWLFIQERNSSSVSPTYCC